MTFPSPLTTPVALAATDVGSCGTFSQTTRGEYTCSVPAGVTSLTFEVRAGNGGNGYGPTSGGQGATITGSIAVTAAETLYITVGSNGWGWDNYPAKNNGGGGGYSSVAHMVDTVLTPLVVAGGGGGAGTADQNARPYAGGAGGNGGTTVTTRGGGAGGSNGTSSSSATNGQDGGTTSVGGTAGSGYAFAGGGVGVDGSRLSTDTWLLGDARPGAGGGGFGAIGGYGNPTKWVPAGTPRSVDYTGAFGAGGEGSTDGGGGGGGGYAGGGGGGAGAVYDSTGGGGGGSSKLPPGATASIVTGATAVGQPHVYLTASDTTAPTVTLEQAAGQADPTTDSPVNFSLVADEALDTTTVTAADFTIANANIQGETFDCSGTPTTCTIPVVPLGAGTVTIGLSRAFSVADLAGNAATTADGTDRSVTYLGPRPVNDDVASAVAVSGTSGSIAGTTVNARLEALEEGHFRVGTDHSVWYTWTNSNRRGLDLVATFSGGDCNTVLEASDFDPVGPPAWNDRLVGGSATEGCIDHSTMKFFATFGTTYWIRVSVGASGTPDTFTLSWTTASPARGSLAISIANVRKDATICTMTVKGVNLLAGQQFAVNAVDPALEEIVASKEYFTQSGRWGPDPVTVTREYWSVGAAGYDVMTSQDHVYAADGVTRIPVSLVNRCGS